MLGASGAFWFGAVIGYITYRTLQHKSESGISDIAAVIAAIGGSAVIALFPVSGPQFDSYAYGLAVGMATYFAFNLGLILFLSSGKPGKIADATKLAAGINLTRPDTPTLRVSV